MILARLGKCDRGSSIVEFALVIPLFLAGMLFVMEGALYTWTKSGLRHGAVEAARCGAIGSTGCTTSDGIKTYASDHAFGLHPATSVFTVTDETCGKQVTVNFQYNGYFGLIPNFDGTIVQSACFLG